MGAFVISPLPSFLLESLQTAGSLRSTGVTPLRSYYRPLRHPLAVHRLPGVSGYTVSFSPPISQRDEEGFSSCFAHPFHPPSPITPPECLPASSPLRRSMFPSPHS